MSGFGADDLIVDALQFAGGEASSAEDVLNARRSMYLLMEEWAAAYGQTFRVRRIFINALPAEPGIELTSDEFEVDDVFDVSVSSKVGPTMSDTFVPVGAKIGPSEYAKITNKTEGGQPSRFYLERVEPPVLFLHPTGWNLSATVWCHAKPDRFDDTSLDLDVPRRWYRALMLGAARDVAAKRQVGNDAELMRAQEARINRLEGMAAQAFAIAKPADRHRARMRIRI